MQEELQRRVQLQCEAAKSLAMEFGKRAADASTKPQLQENLRNASRLHFTVSTILYATLCIAKVDDLEDVLSQDHCKAKSMYFDMDDYRHTLESARLWRTLEAKKCANMMFQSEFMKVFMRNIDDIRAQHRASESENRRELDALGAMIVNFKRAAESGSWSGVSRVVGFEANLESQNDLESLKNQLKEAREEIENLKYLLLQHEQQKVDEQGGVEQYIHQSLEVTESMLDSSTKTIAKLEEMYENLQKKRDLAEDELQRSEAEVLRLQVSLDALASSKEENDKISAIREQQMILEIGELKKVRDSLTEAALGEMNSKNLELENAKLNASLDAAMLRIQKLESDLSLGGGLNGPVAVKAVIHAKNSAIEENEEKILNLCSENARLISSASAQRQEMIILQSKLDENEIELSSLEKNREEDIRALRLERDRLEQTNIAVTDELQAKISELERTLEMAQATLRKQFGDKGLEAIARSALLSKMELSLVVKVQAIGRKFFAKARVNMMRVAKRAQSDGILVAVKPTVQGQSGWYMHPDQHIYHFSLQEDGGWVQTSPPLSPKEWNQVLRHIETKVPSNISKMLSPLNQVPMINPVTMKPLSNVFIENGTRTVYFVQPI